MPNQYLLLASLFSWLEMIKVLAASWSDSKLMLGSSCLYGTVEGILISVVKVVLYAWIS